LIYGIVVNDQGQRFINEDAYGGVLGGAISRQPRGKAWLIVPSAVFWKAIAECLFNGFTIFKYFGIPALLNFAFGGTKRKRTIDRLARSIGVDAVTLQKTIAAYDCDVEAKREDSVGKRAKCCHPLGSGPLYAINVSMSNLFAISYYMPLGGLKVCEETGAVVRADGSLIKGLYAAGMAAQGLCSNGYISGLSLGDGMFSGRRAGRSSAEAARSAIGGNPRPHGL